MKTLNNCCTHLIGKTERGQQLRWPLKRIAGYRLNNSCLASRVNSVKKFFQSPWFRVYNKARSSCHLTTRLHIPSLPAFKYPTVADLLLYLCLMDTWGQQSLDSKLIKPKCFSSWEWFWHLWKLLNCSMFRLESYKLSQPPSCQICYTCTWLCILLLHQKVSAVA